MTIICPETNTSIYGSIITVASMIEALATKNEGELRIYLNTEKTELIEGDVARFFCIGYIRAWQPLFHSCLAQMESKMSLLNR